MFSLPYSIPISLFDTRKFCPSSQLCFAGADVAYEVNQQVVQINMVKPPVLQQPACGAV